MSEYESNSNVSVSFNPTEEIITCNKLETITEIKETIDETVNEIKETSLEPLIQTLMTGADDVSLPMLFEDEIKKIEFKTDLKAIIPISNVKPEQNSFLIKIEQMVEYIKSTLGDNKITATNIIIITTNLMHIVEQYKDLTGSQKKMLILDTLKKVINQNVNDAQERMSLMMIVDMTLPLVLDTLVTAINGGLKFEKDKVVSGFKNLFCCGRTKTN